MGRRIFVGGLPFATDDAQLSDLFAQHGTVESARVVTDKLTGRSRGFGFVEMASDGEAAAAIAALSSAELNGRQLTVNEARPQETRGRSGRPGGNRSFNERQRGGRGRSRW
jgi:RNA recognition motif-containing protein